MSTPIEVSGLGTNVSGASARLFIYTLPHGRMIAAMFWYPNDPEFITLEWRWGPTMKSVRLRGGEHVLDYLKEWIKELP